jgi:pre-rRNA-processing protein TSR1
VYCPPADNSGKIASPSVSHKPAKNVSASSKKARINAQAQKRELKRRNVGEDIKFFSTSSGGSEFPNRTSGIGKADKVGQVPRIISVVPLLPSLSPKRFIANLISSLGLPDFELEEVLASVENAGNYLVRAPRYKTSLQINILPSLNVYDTLDSVLVSDYVVLLTSSVDEVQLEGEAVLRCLQGQAGGIEVISCVQVSRNQSSLGQN